MIPTYITKLPEEIKAKWGSIYSQVEPEHGHEVALVASNSWLKRSQRTFIARSINKVDKIVFTAINDGILVKRSLDDKLIVDFRLQGEGKDKDGKTWSPEVLEKFAKQINEHVYLGDIDHKYWDNMVDNESLPNILENMKYKPGIAKAVKAVYDGEGLYIRTEIDKRYEKALNKVKGVSLEAYTHSNDDDEVCDGNFLGWTMVVNEEPAYDKAVRIN